MRIVIDLDGTICEIKRPEKSYEELEPIPGAIEKIRELRKAGHYIIIQSARNMQTQGGNLGLVMKNIGKITLDWLEKYGFEYDEIFFGKPNGHVYIDDRAIRFKSWGEITEGLLIQEAGER